MFPLIQYSFSEREGVEPDSILEQYSEIVIRFQPCGKEFFFSSISFSVEFEKTVCPIFSFIIESAVFSRF